MNAEASTAENAAAVAAEGATVAPEKASSKKKAATKKGAPKARISAKKATAKKQAKETAKKATKPPKEARERSKKDLVLDLMRRPKGATLAELMDATGWMAHSIRGFISGTLGKKMDLPVVSAKREDGTRVYSLAK